MNALTVNHCGQGKGNLSVRAEHDHKVDNFNKKLVEDYLEKTKALLDSIVPQSGPTSCTRHPTYTPLVSPRGNTLTAGSIDLSLTLVT